MGSVLNFSGHHWHQCYGDACYVCLGGLADCTRCGGAEASIPTDCPGRRMTQQETANVMAGTLDYDEARGGWCGYRARRLTPRAGRWINDSRREK